mmetsp:Transcript_22928/g.50513  ORF Transcript_22928/g.50513 Transcript_22928/m.50513 type:complete len:238 (-) Transcript_22928:535-1248(-)
MLALCRCLHIWQVVCLLSVNRALVGSLQRALRGIRARRLGAAVAVAVVVVARRWRWRCRCRGHDCLEVQFLLIDPGFEADTIVLEVDVDTVSDESDGGPIRQFRSHSHQWRINQEVAEVLGVEDPHSPTLYCFSELDGPRKQLHVAHTRLLRNCDDHFAHGKPQIGSPIPASDVHGCDATQQQLVHPSMNSHRQLFEVRNHELSSCSEDGTYDSATAGFLLRFVQNPLPVCSCKYCL